MGNNSSTSSKTAFSYLNDWGKSNDINIEYEDLNCNSNKNLFTQFEDTVQINNYNNKISIYN